MKKVLIGTVAIVLAGCNALGGIPPETVTAIASAGGGCVQVKSLVMGEAIMIVGSADKGTIRNGELNVAGGCAGITIRETPTPKPVPAVKP